MASDTPPTMHHPSHTYAPLAGFLSYLVPGLGQIYQGRVSKGLLFMVCLYGMFFYGMFLGHWQNVYLPDTTYSPNSWKLGSLSNSVNRLPFLGQFWIGIAAWPAIYHYQYAPKADIIVDDPLTWRNFQRTRSENTLNELQRDGDKFWDLGLIYTIIAGVLNILVIYDAFAGPAFHAETEPPKPREETS